MLGVRRFPHVHLAAGRIKKASLECRAGLFNNGLVLRRLGIRGAWMRESLPDRRRQRDSQPDKGHYRYRPESDGKEPKHCPLPRRAGF